MIKVAIAEPNRKYAKRVKQLLKKFISTRDLWAKICYISGKSYKRNKVNTNYDVVFLDVGLPNCAEIAQELKSCNSKIKIVFLSDGVYNDVKNIEFALIGYDIGISGYILKTYSDDEVSNMFSNVFRLPQYNLIKI